MIDPGSGGDALQSKDCAAFRGAKGAKGTNLTGSARARYQRGWGEIMLFMYDKTLIPSHPSNPETAGNLLKDNDMGCAHSAGFRALSFGPRALRALMNFV